MINNDENFRDHFSHATQQQDRKSHKPLEVVLHGVKIDRIIYEGNPAFYDGEPAFVVTL